MNNQLKSQYSFPVHTNTGTETNELKQQGLKIIIHEIIKQPSMMDIN